MIKLGKLLRSARRRARSFRGKVGKLSIHELCERFPIDRTIYEQWESGKLLPSPYEINRLESVLQRDLFEDIRQKTGLNLSWEQPVTQKAHVERRRWYDEMSKPSTNAANLHLDAPDHGVLSRLGYKVGERGLSEARRQECLMDAYTRPLSELPPVADFKHMRHWGPPQSKARKARIVASLSGFLNLAKRRRHAPVSAIAGWTDDRAWVVSSF